MKKISTLFILLFSCVLLTNCFEDFDDNPVFSSLEVKDFVWKGLNFAYLYKSEVPDLADNRFSSNEEYTQYLNSFETPESLFNHLKHEPQTVDRFSRIYNDYIQLEQQLSGTFVSNGLEINLYYHPNSNTQVFGAITLVLNNSEAANAGLQRGQLFSAVDGTALTESNFTSLLSQSTYTLQLATYNSQGTPETTDDTIDVTPETVTLSRVPYNENPIHKTEIITLSNNEKLGYLMYNGFYANYTTELNNVFADFQANNIQHLVLDLRYNGGGSVSTATYLASMVTGQFTGQIFTKTLYNENLSGNNFDYLFTNTIENGPSINSLNLTKVYVITTADRTASASELIINSLKEYITVVQVGEGTVGKSQVSRIIYDAPQPFSRNNANPNHRYAMLPVVGISVNVNDGQVPSTGINPAPSFFMEENGLNLGILGDTEEPLLARVIEDIENSGRFSVPNNKPNATHKIYRNLAEINPEKFWFTE